MPIKTEDYFIPAEYQLDIETDETATIVYYRIDEQETGTHSVDVSTTENIGPFNEPRTYRVLQLTYGDVTTDIYFNAALTRADQEKLAKFDETEAIAPVADDANGAALATAINALIDRLVAAGMLAEYV